MDQFESATEITEDTGSVEVTTWPQAADKAAFADAQAADKLRHLITHYASNAIKYGTVSRDWVNAHLAVLGAEQVYGSSEYHINTPITGVFGRTITASSRAEALTKFADQVNRVVSEGKIKGNQYDTVYQVKFADATPTFYSGPEDAVVVDPSVLPSLAELKVAIRSMVMEGVTEQNWGHRYAAEAIGRMGLEPLPTLHNKTVQVPVSGTTTFTVRVFADADDAAVQSATAAAVRRAGAVAVRPDEIGEAVLDGSRPRPVEDEEIVPY